MPDDAAWGWWRERRLPAELLHLDTAAAGRSSTATLAATASAITALRPADGQDVTAVRARLLAEHGIVTTAGAVTRAPRDMTEPLLRISPHVDCTPDDLARLRAALQALR